MSGYSYASSSFSSSSSSNQFNYVHGLDLLDYTDTNNRYNKLISNSQLYTIFEKLNNAAYPFLTNANNEVFFKHYDIPSGSWVTSGAEYAKNIVHSFNTRYVKVIGYKKPQHKLISF